MTKMTPSSPAQIEGDILLPLFIAQLPQKSFVREGLTSEAWAYVIKSITAINLKEMGVKESFITLDEYRRILLFGVEHFGEDKLLRWWVSDTKLIHLGPFGQAIASANTLQDSIDVIVSHLATVAPTLRMEHRINLKDIILKLNRTQRVADVEELIVECTALALVNFLLDRGIPSDEIRVCFNHAQRRDDYYYIDLIKIKPTFSQAQTSITFPTAHLSDNNEDASLLLYKQALKDCNTVAESVQSVTSLSQRVAHLLYADGSAGVSYTLDEVANKLNMSSRTISRRLREEGTGFRQVQLEVKVSMAKDLLEKNNKSIKSISFDCGFNSTAAFSRVFKKQIGCTPTEYRKSLIQDPVNNSV